MLWLGPGRLQERREPNESFWEASGVEIEKLTRPNFWEGKFGVEGVTGFFGPRRLDSAK